MNSDTLKSQVLDALAKWIRQRPELDPRDYADKESYLSAAKELARDKRDAETMLLVVRHIDAITGKQIINASRHTNQGRLEMIVKDSDSKPMSSVPSDAESMREHSVEIDYKEGQNFATEYRAGAAYVLAAALWEHARDRMPTPVGNTHEGMSATDWLRKHFRSEFGSKIQRRWFN